MNACSVATRPTSNTKKTKAIGKVSAPGGEPKQNCQAAAHEQEQQVPGEDVGKKSNGEADQPDEVRNALDHEDKRLEGKRHVLDAGR